MSCRGQAQRACLALCWRSEWVHQGCCESTAVHNVSVNADVLQDVNSLRDLYEVNLELALPGAPISFYEVEEGIVSSGQVLPPALISGCEIEDALIGEGSVLRVSALRWRAPWPLCEDRRD